MRNKLIFLYLIILGFTSSAMAQETVIKTWYVADAKIACIVGDAVTSCLRIKDSLSGEWREFPYDIEGFFHEKGFEYIIEVSQEKLEFTEGTGPSFKWSLSRIVSEKTTIFTDKRLLVNNTFHLINIEQYNKKTLAVKAKPFIKFDIDTNLISGFTGCNNFIAPCNYATAFMEFGPAIKTEKACNYQEIEEKLLNSLKGRATFYVRHNMLYMVCENFMTLHLKPERSLDSMMNVIEAEKAPKNDLNFFRTDDGTYIINAPFADGKTLMIFTYRLMKLTADEKKKIKLKFIPIVPSSEIVEIRILTKEHGSPHMSYATIIYNDGTKKDVEIRDAN